MMSEKRFYLGNNDTTICDRSQGGSDGFNMLTIFKVVDLLNEQQATNDYLEEANSRLQVQLGETLRLVDEQQATINKQERKIRKCEAEVGRQLKQIIELQDELKEKEEDEQLYANEIVKLNKEAKEVLDFKSLGGDY